MQYLDISNLKAENMVSRNGNKVPNQLEITLGKAIFFQSYNSLIAKKESGKITLYPDWNYSRTTSKYLALFLHETGTDTRKKVKNGTYEVKENIY